MTAAEAADPNTPLDRLFALASENPELRPAIAANPSTYPDLLTWLGSLGDPAVDAALASRDAVANLPRPPAPSAPPTATPLTATVPTAEPRKKMSSRTKKIVAFSIVGALVLGGAATAGIYVLSNSRPGCVPDAELAGVTDDSTGTVWSWGDNYDGVLGYPGADGEEHPTPQRIPGLADVTAIAGTGSAGYALRGNGTVCAWGFNDDGQLGDGTTWARDYPVQVQGLDGVVAIAANSDDLGSQFALALRDDGTVWSWGSNLNGTLGMSTPDDHRSTAEQIPGLSDIVTIAASSGNGYAIDSGGTLWAWGDVSAVSGEEIDSFAPVETPVAIAGLPPVATVAGGDGNTFAGDINGRLWVWGDNSQYALGNGVAMSEFNDTPEQISGVPRFTATEAGTYQGASLAADGVVWTWGRNGAGELGNGTTNPSENRAPVKGLDAVVDIAMGDQVGAFVLAVRDDGTVWGWGSNTFDVLGPEYEVLSPVQIPGIDGVRAVAATGYCAFALK